MNIQNVPPISSATTGAIDRSQAVDRSQTVDRSQAGTETTVPASSEETLATSGQSDQASLSMASQLMTQVSSLPDVDTEKVAAVQSALAAGTYQISSSDVAGKMIESLSR